MKSIQFILLFCVSTNLWAGPCEDAWKNDKDFGDPTDICRLEWKSEKGPQGVELVEFEKGCSFPDDQAQKCSLIRACGPGKGGDIGASTFRQSTPTTSYCLTKKELEIFSPSNGLSPRAYILCNDIKKPASIKLQSPDGKHTKICPFPFAKKGT